MLVLKGVTKITAVTIETALFATCGWVLTHFDDMYYLYEVSAAMQITLIYILRAFYNLCNVF